jgi:hypothetical protein
VNRARKSPFVGRPNRRVVPFANYHRMIAEIDWSDSDLARVMRPAPSVAIVRIARLARHLDGMERAIPKRDGITAVWDASRSSYDLRGVQ